MQQPEEELERDVGRGLPLHGIPRAQHELLLLLAEGGSRSRRRILLHDHGRRRGGGHARRRCIAAAAAAHLVLLSDKEGSREQPIDVSKGQDSGHCDSASVALYPAERGLITSSPHQVAKGQDFAGLTSGSMDGSRSKGYGCRYRQRAENICKYRQATPTAEACNRAFSSKLSE
uniref:Uncharacterized protein n=3 Tax=Oryza TaxID=4527 RepID=A0A0D3G9T6_9ORYZ